MLDDERAWLKISAPGHPEDAQWGSWIVPRGVITLEQERSFSKFRYEVGRIQLSKIYLHAIALILLIPIELKNHYPSSTTGTVNSSR